MRWAFTIHKKNVLSPFKTLDQVYAKLKKETVGKDDLKYLVMQMERGGNTKRRHIQGYIHYEKQKRATTLGRWFNVQHTAFQKAKGSPAQNQVYCSKTDTRIDLPAPVETGSCPGGSGERSDLKRMAEAIKDDGLESAIDEFPDVFMRYARGSNELSLHYKRKKTQSRREMAVFVYEGTPGSGKSYCAANFDPGNSFDLPLQTANSPVWFDGYAGQRTLLIQDLDPKTIPYRTLLRILDEQPLQVKVSGAFIPAEWNHVVITSMQAPNLWYDDPIDHWALGGFGSPVPGPLQRRIGIWVQFQGVYPTVTYITNGKDVGLPLTLAQCWEIMAEPDEATQAATEAPPVETATATASAPDAAFEVTAEVVQQAYEAGVQWNDYDDWIEATPGVTNLTDQLLDDMDMAPLRPWEDLEADVV